MTSTRTKTVRQLTLAAMFFAIGVVLPFLTGQIPQIGKMLLPMHIPVLLCGLICGWKYGLGVGFLLPLVRSAIFAAPVMFPTGLSMAFELATYGLTVGFLYEHARRQGVKTLYVSMLAAMLAGRAVWGIAQATQLGLGENGFTWQAFMAGAFLNAVPGVILQLVLIPTVMIALDRAGLVKFSRAGETDQSPV